ncbi:MAG: hypothetical protein IM585_16550 [Pseudanabaena sp. M135S2SP2A07QC]|nr:hypothetical protein [Pseudanabaena sp. M090S1SP2A07QC]MCA6508065.1 hypothetical protein [Pseudanabaena sp. M172S2SP2A07QC]MCA6521411.1 hypothetical protein [Pseudanabaena sp. M051S1SP2A07QC]MCA6531470.1 hypothetical protein [Pseudanabaena sp. M125S2SP2A07QC]MCA6534248.1 hypothetical protein [Pseudanabaena sp. M176S2SP2A07QC]MCA6539938.1 hypothetical protein [Pseudanabaena sp. M037S2SP2A07QC]MCA6542963.1 hypothetical protein [Pseudanabaena sp. M074S1SP2A07QC]MCA6547735.1 hypothetical prot
MSGDASKIIAGVFFRAGRSPIHLWHTDRSLLLKLGFLRSRAYFAIAS